MKKNIFFQAFIVLLGFSLASPTLANESTSNKALSENTTVGALAGSMPKAITPQGVGVTSTNAAATATAASTSALAVGGENRIRRIELPAHIPASCVSTAAKRYAVPEMAMLAILKQESGGRLGIVATNKNGSKDYGPAQFNDRSWGRYMQNKYGITLSALTNNMCQALMAQAYALRYEWNRCIKKGRPSIWCAVAYYHSPTKKYQDRYVSGVWKHYQAMLRRGRF